jgi:hypothetical protein
VIPDGIVLAYGTGSIGHGSQGFFHVIASQTSCGHVPGLVAAAGRGPEGVP